MLEQLPGERSARWENGTIIASRIPGKLAHALSSSSSYAAASDAHPVTRRLLGLLSDSRAHLQQLLPAPADRCGRSLFVGAGRALAAELGPRLTDRSQALVSVPGGASLAVDLRTPHGRRWFAWGCCEPALRAMETLVGPGDVVIDAGANIGLFTLVAATKVGPSGRVIACEPAPSTLAILRSNVMRNGYEWVDLHEVAVAEVAGQLELEVFAPGSGLSSFAPAAAGSGERIAVAAWTLDEIAGSLIDRARVVKLDVEGAEMRALQGASVLFERARPDFIVELEPAHLSRQGSSVEAVQELFESRGYIGFAIDGESLKPLRGAWATGGRDPNVVARPRERTAI